MKQLYLIVFLLFTFAAFSQSSSAASGEIEGFSLYPNPVTEGKVYISSLHKTTPKTVLIFDVLGTQVLQTTIYGDELQLSNLNKGIYILRVIEKDKVATRKLIIK